MCAAAGGPRSSAREPEVRDNLVRHQKCYKKKLYVLMVLRQNVASHNVRVTKRKHQITLTTVTSLRFLKFTFWNSYVLKLLRLETLTFREVMAGLALKNPPKKTHPKKPKKTHQKWVFWVFLFFF